LCLSALDEIMGGAPFLTGARLTLADLHAAPMFAYFVIAPEAETLFAERRTVWEWWERMEARESMVATAPP
jgi:glutathione S-transferase